MHPAVETATTVAEQTPSATTVDQPEDFSNGSELKRVNES
jgi:hypothetical protein